MRNRRVLLVEDEHVSRDRLSAVIAGEGYDVVTAENGEMAWNVFRRSSYLVVITDLIMPKMNGLRVLEKIRSLHPTTRVIIITAHGGKQDAIKALKLNAFDYIEKGNSKTIPDLLTAIARAFTEAETQIKTEKEVLSFLTHALRNTLSGGPQTVHQVLRLVESLFPSQQEDQRVYRIRNNVASLYSIFTSIDNMLDAYKFYVSDPVDVGRKWQEDKDGDVPVESLLTLVLRQTMGRILFEEANVGQLKHLMSDQNASSTKEIRESFLRNVLLADDQATDAAVLAWINTYFPAINLHVANSDIRFNASGIRFSLLFAILSEIIYNSLKYSDGTTPIQVKWKKLRAGYIFSCKNEFSGASTERSGSQKGLVFINGLTRIIEGVDFVHRTQGNSFIVELHFQSGSLKA